MRPFLCNKQEKSAAILFRAERQYISAAPKKMAALSKSKMLFHIFCCHPAGIPTYEENFNYGNEGCDGISPNFPLSAWGETLRRTEMVGCMMIIIHWHYSTDKGKSQEFWKRIADTWHLQPDNVSPSSVKPQPCTLLARALNTKAPQKQQKNTLGRSSKGYFRLRGREPHHMVSGLWGDFNALKWSGVSRYSKDDANGGGNLQENEEFPGWVESKASGLG